MEARVTTQDQVLAMTSKMARFTALVGKRLPDDVLTQLGRLRKVEDGPLPRIVYDTMFRNLELATELDRPCCQDTGALQFFVRAGARFPLLGQLRSILTEAVREATRTAPLRHNAVETFDEKNTGTNTGTNLPWIDWEIVSDDANAEIDVYMAGGGCTLPGAAKVLMPGEGYEGVVKFVFDVISSYGVNACPPLLVGVGISTSVECAALLSKRAIQRRIGTRNPNPKAAEMERLLEDGLNALGIGPQGLTGNASVMGVHIENTARHPSVIGVGVSTGCWAHRRGTIRFDGTLRHEVLTHHGVTL
jgi:L(+)-tartrate dehydratase alpha subunit